MHQKNSNIKEVGALIDLDWDYFVPLVSAIIWLLTIIASLILHFKKRIWILAGVLAAFAINGISWIVFFGAYGGTPSLGELLISMGIPSPAGIILLVLIGQ